MIIKYFLFFVWIVRIVESEVVDSHFTNCSHFFYNGTPPQGFEYGGLHDRHICQLYNNTYHFATLYNSFFRIPMYSAYKVHISRRAANQPTRRSKWFIEPQLSDVDIREMTTEGISDMYKRQQAINIDYMYTNYDRGHLNPNFYHYDNSRTATFTLTNAVPQDPCFNQQVWNDMEKMAKSIMDSRCNFLGAKRYFVTGAVPSRNMIPYSEYHSLGDLPRDYNRVSVPSAMWTAACCDASDALHAQNKNSSFSFGYYGENVPDAFVQIYRVDSLNAKLTSVDFRNRRKFSIFKDSCFSHSNISDDVLSELAIPVERRNVNLFKRLAISPASSVMSPAKNEYIESVQSVLQKRNIATRNLRFADVDFGLLEERRNIFKTRNLFYQNEIATVLSCPNIHTVRLPIAAASTEIVEGYPYDPQNDVESCIAPVNDFDDRKQWSGSNYDKYIVVPASESTLSAMTSRCRHGHRCGYHNEAYRWCYIDWDANWDYCCHSKCMFDQDTSFTWCYAGPLSHWQYCSQRSSMISIIGRTCRADHECGLHGSSYYWCYTDTKNNWEYCCQPWHECNNHGESYKWCYTGYKKKTKWQYCTY